MASLGCARAWRRRVRSTASRRVSAARHCRRLPARSHYRPPPLALQHEVRPNHLRPAAELAERVLLPGDPGRALAVAQALLEQPPRMFNHARGLWGYTGNAARRRAADGAGDRMGGPSAAIVCEELIALGARRGSCGSGPAERSTPRSSWARCSPPSGAARRRRERGARRRRRARSPTPSCWRGWWPPARGRPRSRPATSSTTRARARRPAGPSAAPWRSRWRPRRSSRWRRAAGSRRPACSA